METLSTPEIPQDALEIILASIESVINSTRTPEEDLLVLTEEDRANCSTIQGLEDFINSFCDEERGAVADDCPVAFGRGSLSIIMGYNNQVNISKPINN